MKSVRNFRVLITCISKMDSRLWEIDVEHYNDENILKINNILELQKKKFEQRRKEQENTKLLSDSKYYSNLITDFNYKRDFNADWVLSGVGDEP